jgi:hypothetical protein
MAFPNQRGISQFKLGSVAISEMEIRFVKRLVAKIG